MGAVHGQPCRTGPQIVATNLVNALPAMVQI